MTEVFSIIKTGSMDPELIDNTQYQPRASIDPDKMVELINSIAASGGNLESVLLMKKGDVLVTLAGHRRVQACIELQIPVNYRILKEMEDKEAWTISLATNIKEDMKSSDMILTISRIYSYGYSTTEIGEKLGVAQSTVSRYLSLSSLDKPVLHYIDTTALSISKSILIASIKQSEQVLLADFCIANGWTTETTKKYVEMWQELKTKDKRALKNGTVTWEEKFDNFVLEKQEIQNFSLSVKHSEVFKPLIKLLDERYNLNILEDLTFVPGCNEQRVEIINSFKRWFENLNLKSQFKAFRNTGDLKPLVDEIYGQLMDLEDKAKKIIEDEKEEYEYQPHHWESDPNGVSICAMDNPHNGEQCEMKSKTVEPFILDHSGPHDYESHDCETCGATVTAFCSIETQHNTLDCNQATFRDHECKEPIRQDVEETPKFNVGDTVYNSHPANIPYVGEVLEINKNVLKVHLFGTTDGDFSIVNKDNYDIAEDMALIRICDGEKCYRELYISAENVFVCPHCAFIGCAKHHSCEPKEVIEITNIPQEGTNTATELEVEGKDTDTISTAEIDPSNDANDETKFRIDYNLVDDDWDQMRLRLTHSTQEYIILQKIIEITIKSDANKELFIETARSIFDFSKANKLYSKPANKKPHVSLRCSIIKLFGNLDAISFVKHYNEKYETSFDYHDFGYMTEQRFEFVLILLPDYNTQTITLVPRVVFGNIKAIDQSIDIPHFIEVLKV